MSIDLALLAQALATLIAGAPALLENLGKKAADKAAEAAGEGLVAQIWRRLSAADEPEPVNDAAKELAKSPDDDLAQQLLALQIQRLLQRDSELAQSLHQLASSSPGTHYRATATGEAVVAQAGGVAARQVAIGRDVQGNVMQLFVDPAAMAAPKIRRLLGVDDAPGEAELEAATADYLRHLLDMHRYLGLRGMGVHDRVALKLPLLELFVPLVARIATPAGDAWNADERIAGRRLTAEEREAIGEHGKPHPVLDLLQRNDGLVVLGDPGAGKTTLLKFLAVALASGQGEELGLGRRLPIMLPLAAYARVLAGREIALEGFIATYYRELGVALPLGAMLQRALAEGRALFLFDGLDEVRDEALRARVVANVKRFFALHRRTGNKFVLTSRVVGYKDVRPQAEGLEECTLLDFGADEIESFIERWVTAVEAAAGAGGAGRRRAAEEKRELLDAVRRSPGVRSLASNPLLLTILALMKRQGVSLPERRVELYQNYVETLIRHWNLARSLEEGRVDRSLDLHETLKVLAPLALWMHETSPGIGLVPEAKVRQRLETIYRQRGADDPAASARGFLRDIREHAGLLLDRGGRQYGFIHLTFQEYLAAVALARLGQTDPSPVIDALTAQLGEAPWHEVARLAVGVLGLVQGRDEAASEVVRALADAGEPGVGIELAGLTVADVWPGGVTEGCRAKVRERLLATMRDDRRVPAARRAAAGAALAAVGDLRREVLDLDAMQFCSVPAGPFCMGSERNKHEKPVHTVDVKAFRIGRFPVTVAQYEMFRVAQDGDGPAPGFHPAAATCPKSEITWHDARAFCEWLTRRWHASGDLPTDWHCRLPTEA